MKPGDFRSLDTGQLSSQPFPLVSYDARILLTESAFDDIDSRANKEREVGGVLVGEIYSDEGGPYLQVEAIIEALYAKEQGAEVTFTHNSWEHIHRELDSKHRGKKIVGWYHTHPGFGIFLSEQDKFIHKNFFSEPYQIALVYDPVTRDHGIFVWRSGEPWRIRRYWIGTRQHDWDGPREVPRPTPSKKATHAEGGEQNASNRTPRADTMVPEDRDRISTRLLIMQALPIVALLCALGAGIAGFKLGDAQSQVRARAEGAVGAVSSINTDMLAAVNAVLKFEAIRAQLDELSKKLTEIGQVSTDPALKPAIDEAQAYFKRTREQMAITHDVVARLQDSVRSSKSSRENSEQSIRRHDAALSQMFVYLIATASRDKHPEDARKLAQFAMSVDPANRQTYESLLRQVK